MIKEIFYVVAIIGFCVGVGFGIYFLTNFLEYQMIKYNCDQIKGNLTYEGHKSNWLFVTDVWACKRESQRCFSNGVEINCSTINDLPDLTNWEMK